MEHLFYKTVKKLIMKREDKTVKYFEWMIFLLPSNGLTWQSLIKASSGLLSQRQLWL